MDLNEIYLGDAYELINKIENLASEFVEGADITLTYEIGKISLAKTEYTEIVDKTVADCENVVPLGWKLYNGFLYLNTL